jgi:hypothetical protein
MRKPAVTQVLVVTGVAALMWGVVLAAITSLRFAGDPRGLLFLGSDFHHPAALAGAPRYGAQGYDGQFYAALATDPLMLRADTATTLDAPGYRGLHLTVPLAAWLLAATQPALAVRIYQALCWLLAIAAIYLAADWLRERDRSPWWALVLVPNAGLASSIIRSTPDGAALALVLAALWAYRRDRRALAVALLTAATLTRETMIVAAIGVALVELRSGRSRQAVRYAAVPGAALFAVMLWRQLTLATPGRLLGGTYGVPFAWVLQKVDQMLAASIRITSIELWGFLALIAALAGLAAFGRADTDFSLEETLFLLFMVVSWTLSFSVYVDVYGYTRALMPLPFLALLIAAGHEDRVKRAMLLLVPAAFAFVGVLMIRAEIKAALLASHG